MHIQRNGTGGGRGSKLRAVGLKIPNRWGLYDCHGNVNEFVLDVALYDTSTADEADPLGHAVGVESYHFRKGGSCRSSFNALMVGAYRGVHTIAPSQYGKGDGFRLCWRFPTPETVE